MRRPAFFVVHALYPAAGDADTRSVEAARPDRIAVALTPRVGVPHSGSVALAGVAAVAAGVAAVGGASSTAIVAFLAYQAAWVALPGLALVRVLLPRVGGAERLGVGWAVGYAVSIASFHATAAAGARSLHLAVPLLGLLLLVPGRERARPGPRPPALGVGAVAALALVCNAVLVVPLVPLPGTTSAAYPPDPMFHLAVAAEALHHFPVTDPKVAGTSLPYHLFAHYDMASVAQVTGADLSTVVFRLAPLPLLALSVLLVALLAVHAGAGRVGAVSAAALLVLVGEIDLQPDALFPFWGGTFFGSAFSASFLLSLPLFGALLLVARRLALDEDAGRGAWVVCTLLLWALGGAKAGSLAVVTAGLLLFALARGIHARVLEARALTLAALATAIAVVQLFVLYGGSGSGGLDPLFLGAVRSASAVEAIAGWSAAIGPIAAPLAWMIGLVAIFGATVLAALLTPARGRVALLYAVMWVPGALLSLSVTHPGGSQLHLLQLGSLALAALGGVGVERVLGGPRGRRVALASVALAIAFAGLAYLPAVVSSGDPYVLRYGVVSVVACAAVAAARRVGTSRLRAATVVALAAAAVNVPLDTVAPLASAVRAGEPLSAGDDVTPELYAGLLWIREHSRTSDVLAVNNVDTNHGRKDNFVHSALAERRVFLEGEQYGVAAVAKNDNITDAFVRRRQLNDAAFAGDGRALRELVRAHGVRFLVIDKLHADAAPAARAHGRVVFTNGSVDIVEVSAR